MRIAIAFALAACSTNSQPAASVDAPPPPPPPMVDAAPVSPPGLGTVSNVHPCSTGPSGNCTQVTISGCPGIESESLDASLSISAGGTPSKGTIVHFSGDDGTTFNRVGETEYQTAGFLQVFVAWQSPGWEQTSASGIKTAACRPATLLKWIFDNIHNGDRTTGYCAEGHSGGSGQIGYALAFYGVGDFLDYANEVSGPPFARIDIGCNVDAPQTQTVCGESVRTDLPTKVGTWENSPYCRQPNVPDDELARWQADSIAVGGTYNYPNTNVQFFDCTNNATAVTAMSTYYYDQINTASGGQRVGYTCFSAADNCKGEDLGNGGRVAIDAMIQGCVANH